METSRGKRPKGSVGVISSSPLPAGQAISLGLSKSREASPWAGHCDKQA